MEKGRGKYPNLEVDEQVKVTEKFYCQTHQLLIIILKILNGGLKNIKIMPKEKLYLFKIDLKNIIINLVTLLIKL